nr:secoisolariciresinol dehydrogenase-like [Tanacetum cinerariifolium]
MANKGTIDVPVTIPRLSGKVALITGGARGIGESIARLFTKHGAKVVTSDILDDLGQTVVENIGLEKASYIHCDVCIESDVEKAINYTIDKHGKLDIMVNNAAVAGDLKFSILENNVSDFERVLSINVTGVFLGTKHAARVMIPARGGSIISIGSIASTVGGNTSHAYTSSKHAVAGLTKNVAAELGEFGIRVNCVSPHFLLTPATMPIVKKYPDLYTNVYSNLKGIELKEQDVAEATLFLASDESKYISGHNLAIDGGFTAINPSFGLFSKIKAT